MPEKLTHMLTWSGEFGPVHYRVTLRTDTDPSVLSAVRDRLAAAFEPDNPPDSPQEPRLPFDEGDPL